jgi:hypothetical protein
MEDKNKDSGRSNGKHKINEDAKVVYNNNKNHKCWRLQDGCLYSKIFFPFQKHCPKTEEGKQMCMKFLIHGFCDSSCSRAHKLASEDESNFDIFYHKCCDYKEGDKKLDF